MRLYFLAARADELVFGRFGYVTPTLADVAAFSHGTRMATRRLAVRPSCWRPLPRSISFSLVRGDYAGYDHTSSSHN